MPSSLIIRMTGDADKRHGAYIASMLQGVMMEIIDPSYARVLHQSGIHPYSQYVEEKEQEIFWHINALTKEAEDEILGPLQENDFTQVNLEHREEVLLIQEKTMETCSYEQLIQDYYLGDCSRNIRINTVSPMAFKQGGKYCIFPSTRLIFQSLMMRFDACSPDSSVFSEELLHEFESHTEITDYRLRSVRFSLEGTKIPSFSGEIKIHINGPQQMANVAWMLIRFAEFSGIGIKTGMGMGAVKEYQVRAVKDYH